MKNHMLTIVLLLIASAAFTLRFFTEGTMQCACDIFAFALPTVAAIVEIVVSERNGKKMKAEIKKRAVVETLTQEEFERRKAEGTLNETTFYATIEE